MVFFSLARKAPQKGSPRKAPMKRLEPGSGIFYNFRDKLFLTYFHLFGFIDVCCFCLMVKN
jgi:hypothetical protein